MVKFAFKGQDDRENLGLGITAENVKRMKDGQPIRIDLAALGLSVNGTVMLFYGETEQSLYDSLKEFIGPETDVHIDPRVKR